MKTQGVPACALQAYFTGFAMSLAGSSALKFDIADRLENDARLYDGFAEYAFSPSGDIWASK